MVNVLIHLDSRMSQGSVFDLSHVKSRKHSAESVKCKQEKDNIKMENLQKIILIHLQFPNLEMRMYTHPLILKTY